jgi:hypothetical protein
LHFVVVFCSPLFNFQSAARRSVSLFEIFAKMATEPVFLNIGSEVGLYLWRIEKLLPVRILEVKGKFYQGDAYILLSVSKTKSNALIRSIHFWLGSESSQDEQGIAAYKTVELDDSLSGSAVQYREVEGNESQLFLSYFRETGIRW